MHIWSSNIYIKYSNMYIMPYDCLQHFCFNFFNTFIDSIIVNLVLYKHEHKRQLKIWIKLEENVYPE